MIRRARVLVPLMVAALLGAGCQPPSSWTTPVSGLAPVLLSVWGSSPTDVWAVGGTCDQADCKNTAQSLVLHFDGSSWTKRDAGAKAILWWVHGFAPDDVWIAGEQGTILHFDGARFTPQAEGLAPDVKLFGIWGKTPRALWAVGGKPDQSSTVLRFDGATWSKDMTAPSIQDGQFGGTWFKVWGSAADDVWLVGQRGSLVRWNGAAYEKQDLSPLGVKAQGLFTAAGRARDDVYVVGGDFGRGLALHFDGQRWENVAGLDLSQSPLLTGVYETSAGDVTITGMSGMKFRKDGATWHDDNAFMPYADLHAVWMAGPNDVFAVGGNFVAQKNGVVAHYGAAIPGTIK